MPPQLETDSQLTKPELDFLYNYKGPLASEAGVYAQPPVRKKGIAEGFREILDAENLPFLGPIWSTSEAGQDYLTAKALGTGTLTPEQERTFIEKYQDENAQSSLGYKIVKGLTTSAVIGTEFALTSGLAAGARVGTEKLLQKGAAKFIKDRVKDYTARAAGRVVQAAALGSIRVPGEVLKRVTPAFNINKVGDKSQLSVGPAGQSLLEATKDASVHQFAEYISESMGGPLIEGIRKAAGPLANNVIGNAIVSTYTRFRNKFPATPVKIQDLFAKSQFHGIVGELLEEEASKFMQDIGNVQRYQLSTPGEAAVTTGVAGILGGAGVAIGALSPRPKVGVSTPPGPPVAPTGPPVAPTGPAPVAPPSPVVAPTGPPVAPPSPPVAPPSPAIVPTSPAVVPGPTGVPGPTTAVSPGAGPSAAPPPVAGAVEDLEAVAALAPVPTRDGIKQTLIASKGYDEEQAEVALTLVDHFADFTNTPRDQFLQDRIALVRNLPPDAANRGNIDFLPNGKAIISLYTGAADFSTFPHEFMHLARRVIENSQGLAAANQVLRDYVGLATGEAWDASKDEHVARSWERYLRSSQLPGDKKLQDIFARIYEWMQQIYSNISKSFKGVSLNPDIIKLFDSMASGKPPAGSVAPVKATTLRRTQYLRPPTAESIKTYDAPTQAETEGVARSLFEGWMFFGRHKEPAPPGWKLHLTTKNAKEVSYLIAKNLNLDHKVGHNGGQEGKDLTVYIGSMDDAYTAALAINKLAGHLLETPKGDVNKSDIPFVGNIVGRFDINQDKRADDFAQYGFAGIPAQKTDINAGLWDPQYDIAAKNAALQKNLSVLTDRFGNFFTGSSTETKAIIKAISYNKKSVTTPLSSTPLTDEPAPAIVPPTPPAPGVVKLSPPGMEKKLKAVLFKSSPNFKTHTVTFKSPFDLAAYMVRDREKLSKADPKVVAVLRKYYDDDTIIFHGTRIRNKLKELAGAASSPTDNLVLDPQELAPQEVVPRFGTSSLLHQELKAEDRVKQGSPQELREAFGSSFTPQMDKVIAELSAMGIKPKRLTGIDHTTSVDLILNLGPGFKDTKKYRKQLTDAGWQRYRDIRTYGRTVRKESSDAQEKREAQAQERLLAGSTLEPVDQAKVYGPEHLKQSLVYQGKPVDIIAPRKDISPLWSRIFGVEFEMMNSPSKRLASSVIDAHQRVAHASTSLFREFIAPIKNRKRYNKRDPKYSTDVLQETRDKYPGLNNSNVDAFLATPGLTQDEKDRIAVAAPYATVMDFIRIQEKSDQRVKMADEAYRGGTAVGDAFSDVVSGAMTEDQAATFRKLRDPGKGRLKDLLIKLRDIDNWGLDNYVTKSETGQWAIIGMRRDAEGNLVEDKLGFAYTRYEAIDHINRALQDKEDEYDQFKIEPGHGVGADWAEEVSPITVKRQLGQINKLLGEFASQTKAAAHNPSLSIPALKKFLLKQGVAGIISAGPKTTFASYVKQRKGKLRGEENGLDALERYIRTMMRRHYLDPVILEARKDMPQMPPNEQQLFEDMISAAKGVPTLDTKIVDDILQRMSFLASDLTDRGYLPEKAGYTLARWLDLRPGALPAAVSAITSAQATLKLGLRTAAWFTNAVSGVIHVISHTSLAAMQNGITFARTPEGKQFLKDNEFATSQVSTLTGVDISPSSLFRPLGFFRAAERGLMKLSLATNYVLHRDLLLAQGIGKPEAESEATILSHEAARLEQAVRTVASVGKVFRSPTARLVFQFQTYPVKEIEFMLSLTPNKLAKHLALQGIVFGPAMYMAMFKAMPFLLGQLFFMGWGKTGLEDLEQWFEQEYSKLWRGVAGVLGMSLEQSAAIALPYAKNPQLMDALGPTISDLSRLTKSLMGQDANYRFQNFVEDSLPFMEYGRRVWDAQYSDGWVNDSQGRPLYQLKGPWEWTMTGLGIKSVGQARIETLSGISRRSQAAFTAKRERAIKRIVEGLDKGYTRDLDIESDMLLYGLTPEALKGEFIARHLPPELRYLKNASRFTRPYVFDDFYALPTQEELETFDED